MTVACRRKDREQRKKEKIEKKCADEKQKRLKNLTEKVAKGLQDTVFFIREAFKKMIFKIFFEELHVQEVNQACKDIMANITAI